MRPNTGGLFSPGYEGGNARRVHSSAHQAARDQHGSGARGSDPMQSEPTQRSGQRRHRTPSPKGRGGLRPGGPVTASEWQDQVDGLQQHIGTLNRSLANHANASAELETQMQANVQPSTIKRIEDLAASVDRRFIEGGERVSQKLERLKMEIRAFASEFREVPRSPEPPPRG